MAHHESGREELPGLPRHVHMLTAEGSKLIRKVFADHGMEEALSCLDDSEKEILRNLLRKVSHGAENRATVNSSIGQNEQANGERS